jgi:hypothetical protein
MLRWQQFFASRINHPTEVERARSYVLGPFAPSDDNEEARALWDVAMQTFLVTANYMQ